MAYRKQPFGYRMENGTIHIIDAEAKIVRMIFVSYAEGSSYDTLAVRLNSGNIPYFPGKPWNKNNIARILKNEQYLGDEIYPRIIEKELFQKRLPPVSGKSEHPQLKRIRILARCAVCGGSISRERKDLWRCPHCGTYVRSADQHLLNAASELLRRLCEHPESVVLPSGSSVECGDVLAAEKELTYEMEAPKFDESAARAKAISLAAARFQSLGSGDYETMRIKYILSNTEQDDGLDTALLRQITEAILIHSSGTVSLKLKNGQIIE